MARLVLILVLGGFALFGLTNIYINQDIAESNSVSVNRYELTQARNIANSAVEMCLSKLADTPDWRVLEDTKMELFGGVAWYTVTTFENGDISYNYLNPSESNFLAQLSNFFNNNNQILAGGWYKGNKGKGNGKGNGKGHGNGNGNGNKTGNENDNKKIINNNGSNAPVYVKVNVTGVFHEVSKSVSVIATFYDPSNNKFLPGAVNSLITANSSVSTKGNLTVDGRDHSITGNLVPNSGVIAVSSTSNISRGGNSKYGGTYDETDYLPSRNYNSNLVSKNTGWENGFPSTPDLVMGGSANGFPEGKLKQVAINGKNGSQYVTNPDDLNYPLKGITYVELPDNDTWQSMNIEGSGILVVHNSGTNSVMKNLNSGTFKGLLIADDIVHIHSNILGAVVVLSAYPSSGNCIGNGNGSVLYSSEAIMEATGLTGVAFANNNGNNDDKNNNGNNGENENNGNHNGDENGLGNINQFGNSATKRMNVTKWYQ